jgi:hypothetical protein
MIRLWNRLTSKDESRLTRQLSNWDKTRNGWCKEIKHIMRTLECVQCFDLNSTIDLTIAKKILFENDCNIWQREVISVPKLRTYVLYKDSYFKEHYVSLIHNRGHRSAIAQFRCGILPLSIETGRFNAIPVEFRLCTFCDDNVIEDEVHFLLYCEFYKPIRERLFLCARSLFADFDNADDTHKLRLLMSAELVKNTAAYIFNAMSKRRKTLYN